ncbi:hypothetical protein [Kribbella sp. DT2]|uniref:hypothetical protein n=1 Tax=Kribbella sp. DT2 TaxID=3393427 RepID=UPI003CFB3A8E
MPQPWTVVNFNATFVHGVIEEVSPPRWINEVAVEHAVIWTADTNNPAYDKATAQDTERKVFANGIDRIDWLAGDGSVQLELTGTRAVPMSVDTHEARVALFRIRLA